MRIFHAFPLKWEPRAELTRRTRRLACAVICAVFISSTLSSRGAEGQDLSAIDAGQTIFNQMSTNWANNTYPEMITYTIEETAAADGASLTRHYHGKVDVSSGQCQVNSISDEEQANPATPHGTNLTYAFKIGFSSGRQPVGASDDVDATIARGDIAKPKVPPSPGVPDLSPLYSFGLRPNVDPELEIRTSSTEKVIGRVASVRRRYEVVLLGEEVLDDDVVFHLKLTPLADPHRNRVRDLWVSKATGDVVQARVDGNFLESPESGIPWLIRFQTINGATYINSETSEVPMRLRSGTLDSVTVAFRDITAGRQFGDPLLSLPTASNGGDKLEEPDQPPDSASDC